MAAQLDYADTPPPPLSRPALLVAYDCPFCDSPCSDTHQPNCTVLVARAFVAAHPATDTAGEVESEEED